MIKWFVRRWFLISLVLVLLLGFLRPEQLQPLANSRTLRSAIVAAVLFVMALPLETSAMWRTLRQPWAALLASAINMGLLPLLAWVLSQALRGDLATGLLVAAAAPCTLASAAVWTRWAGGNDAVAILVTILTNATCFLFTPLWLVAMTGSDQVHIELSEMVTKLGLLVVTPMVAAQLLRQFRPLGSWATRRKVPLSIVAQTGILCMVLIGAVQCGTRLAQSQWGDDFAAADFVLMALCALGLHLVTLAAGHGLAWTFGMPRPERIAVGFAGSQKTLMVGLHVAITYYGGLTILPMVAYHVGQLVADTVIANRLRDRASKEKGTAADKCLGSSTIP